MAKQVIRLTQQELHNIIVEATNRVLSEMDDSTYSRIHNASHRAMQDIQNGNYERSVNGKKVVNNDDIISRADSLEPQAQSHWLKDYVGKTFKFFGRSQMGLPAHVLFTFDKITKFETNKTILVGSVTFNRNQINGDGIIIDFTKGVVKYHERGNRYAYTLEIDNRYKPLWDEFTNKLKTALDARQY